MGEHRQFQRILTGEKTLAPSSVASSIDAVWPAPAVSPEELGTIGPSSGDLSNVLANIHLFQDREVGLRPEPWYPAHTFEMRPFEHSLLSQRRYELLEKA